MADAGIEIEMPAGLAVDAPGTACVGWTGAETKAVALVKTAAFPSFTLEGSHLVVSESVYVDCSDDHAELVSERIWQLHPAEKAFEVRGNVISFEDPRTRSGWCWILLAPSQAVRTWDPAPWLRVVRVNGAWYCEAASTACAYVHARVPYAGGGAGRTLALQRFQQKLDGWDERRDGGVASNTWGDRSRADRLSEAFLRDEITAAAALGIDVVQIDDGWQRGRTANTEENGGVWNGFWAADARYWEPDPQRFPNGLAPIAAFAAAKGIELALWYAPDSSDEATQWERDAEQIIRLSRETGITRFKIDAVKLTTARSEQRFRHLLDRLQIRSGGTLRVDLDTTAESRLGFWGWHRHAVLYLENRYTDWANYFPHATLRTLWQLAHTVHPRRLRLEFLNHARNEERYAGDPLRPSLYPPEWLFASVMVASPLAFFEVSRLPIDYVERLRPLLQLWREHRARLHGGCVLPLGDAPDGYALAGFVVVDARERATDLLAFRCAGDHEAAGWQLAPGIAFAGAARRLAGTARLSCDSSLLSVRFVAPFTFGWWQFAPSSAS